MIVLLAALGLIGGGLWLYAPDKPRAALEAQYAQPPSEFLQIAGIRLHVRDTGPRDAPPVILLHGFGSSLLTWEPWARSLSYTHRVIRYDLPGFGLTGADPTKDYLDERGVEVLGALMDRLDVKRASLVGNSMGGKVAWMFAAEYPDRVDRLVLISPDGFASPQFPYGRKQDVPLVAELLPYTLPTVMLRLTLDPAYGDQKRLTPEIVQRYRDMILAPGVRQAVLDRTAQVMPQPPGPMLRHVHAPTLLVWGEKDGVIPFRKAGDYLAAMPNARLLVFPDLGHVPMEEAPARSLPPVEAFLDGSL